MAPKVSRFKIRDSKPAWKIWSWLMLGLWHRSTFGVIYYGLINHKPWLHHALPLGIEWFHEYLGISLIPATFLVNIRWMSNQAQNGAGLSGSMQWRGRHSRRLALVELGKNPKFPVHGLLYCMDLLSIDLCKQLKQHLQEATFFENQNLRGAAGKWSIGCFSQFTCRPCTSVDSPAAKPRRARGRDPLKISRGDKISGQRLRKNQCEWPKSTTFTPCWRMYVHIRRTWTFQVPLKMGESFNIVGILLRLPNFESFLGTWRVQVYHLWS